MSTLETAENLFRFSGARRITRCNRSARERNEMPMCFESVRNADSKQISF